RDVHEPHPDLALLRREPAREPQRRLDVAARELLVALLAPGLDAEHHEVDLLEIGVAELVAEKAVRLDRRVHAELLRGREQLHDEAMLHQRLATAHREAAGHHREAMAVLADLLRGLRDADRIAVAHRPGIRVVTIAAAPQAARRPRDDPHAG